MVSQLILVQTQILPLRYSVNSLPMFECIVQHVKSGVPPGCHITWHEHYRLAQVLENLTPCREHNSGWMNDFVCQLSQLGYRLSFQVSVFLTGLTFTSANLTGRMSLSSASRSSSANSSTSSTHPDSSSQVSALVVLSSSAILSSSSPSSSLIPLLAISWSASCFLMLNSRIKDFAMRFTVWRKHCVCDATPLNAGTLLLNSLTITSLFDALSQVTLKIWVSC